MSTVLVVDDSLTVRMDLVDSFEAAGLSAIGCATAAAARAALARGGVDLVVLDVLLPDADGVELLAEIRGRHAKLPVVMLSAETEVKDRIRGLQTGADDYVGKPYDASWVVARGKELVARGSSPPIAARAPVLVVDDSETYREALREALERAGHAVVTAANGDDGLKRAADVQPAAIVVDGVMPGIDGVAFIRRVRLDAALRGTPCLLLTASDDPRAELNALDAGADAFVRKDEHIDLVLARLGAALRAAPPSSGKVASLAAPKRILAVDDSATYLNELSAMLRGDGYDVVAARSGEEALELLAVQSVDCILLDLLMPGIGGEETCRRIKASPTTRDVPLVMLTALEDRAAMIAGLGSGADDYISKASELDVLRARVQAQIRRKQFEDENRRIREAMLQSELVSVQAISAQKLAEAKAALADEVMRRNKELEAFSYSVSHDLRAPLRSIDGFSQALIEDYGEQLDEKARGYLARVRGAAQRMGELIDDLLQLSRVSRAELVRARVDVSDMAQQVGRDLARREPDRTVALDVADGLIANADARLVRVLLDNLLGNAWKFTARTAAARVEVGVEMQRDGRALFVRDNGAGFDMAYVEKLFSPFQRLHSEAEFPGTGIGLATVQRIADRHGGRAWAKGAVGAGATVYFTLEPPAGRERS